MAPVSKIKNTSSTSSLYQAFPNKGAFPVCFFTKTTRLFRKRHAAAARPAPLPWDAQPPGSHCMRSEYRTGAANFPRAIASGQAQSKAVHFVIIACFYRNRKSKFPFSFLFLFRRLPQKITVDTRRRACYNAVNLLEERRRKGVPAMKKRNGYRNMAMEMCMCGMRTSCYTLFSQLSVQPAAFFKP